MKGGKAQRIRSKSHYSARGVDMTMIAFDLPDGACAALRKDPREMESELRMAATAKWYELGLVFQGDIRHPKC